MTRQKIRTALSTLRQALAGDNTIDYTRGSIGRATFLLAVPMVLEMAMEAVFALVDIYFVSRLGEHAVSTVGLTEAMITLLYAVAIGLSMGATAMVARRIGEKNTKAATRVAGQALWLGLLVSVVVGVIGLLFPRQLLTLMGAEAAVLDLGTNYTRLMFAGSFTIMFLFLINAIFRGAGDASLAMRALVLANGINIVLDPLLIFGLGPFPELGVTGAAVATNIGRGIGALYGIYYLTGGSSPDGQLRAGLGWLGNFILVRGRHLFARADCRQPVVATGNEAARADRRKAVADTGNEVAEADRRQLAHPARRGYQPYPDNEVAEASRRQPASLAGSGKIHLRASDMRLELKVIWSLIRISIGGIAQFLIATASWVFLVRIVAAHGSDAVAGYTVAVRIAMFLLLPAWGLSNAAATMVGQNLGAKLPDRAATAVWRIAGYNSIYMGLVALLILVCTEPIASYFSTDPAVLEYMTACMRIFAYGYIPWGFGMATIQAFNGAGDTMTPTYLNMLCFWLIQIPLAYLLATEVQLAALYLPGWELGFNWGPNGVFWAVFVADTTLGVLGVVMFARGKWRTRQL